MATHPDNLAEDPGTTLVDTRSRPLHDLRISVTDRCNFRCVYCMPKELFGADHAFLDRRDLLSFEEIARVARSFAGLGVSKLRLTGGEPMVRKDLPRLIEMLARIDGVDDLSLTTNASLLSLAAAGKLRDAGLKRITISLDAIDEGRFGEINDVRFPVSRVLDGIANAGAAGLGPIKVNVVVARGMNEDQVLPLVRHFKGSGVILRFIEFMDVGNTNDWRMDRVVSGRQILDTINAEFPIEPLGAQYHGEVAKRWRFIDGDGEIGVITSVTHPFCGACTRARLSAEGRIYTCLFASRGHDVKTLLRGGAEEAELNDFIAGIWRRRDDRYSEQRSSATVSAPKIEMSYIGG